MKRLPLFVIGHWWKLLGSRSSLVCHTRHLSLDTWPFKLASIITTVTDKSDCVSLRIFTYEQKGVSVSLVEVSLCIR